jgi:hypothetical protein
MTNFLKEQLKKDLTAQFKKEKAVASSFWKGYLKILIVFWFGIGIVATISSIAMFFTQPSSDEPLAGLFMGIVFIGLALYVWKRTHLKKSQKNLENKITNDENYKN